MTPVLYPPYDGSDLERVRAAGEDPLVMYLVAPRRPAGSTGALLVDAATATLRCAETFERDDEWAQGFHDWEEHSFRKVCLRARPSELERAARLPHVACGEVLCFPPRRRSAAEPELARLQAHIGGPLVAGEQVAGASDGPLMMLLICEELGMTAGKACAQVGHAVLLGRMLHSPASILEWEAAGGLVRVGLTDVGCFERVRSELTVVGVRDAGLTQVRPGTETVLATDPGADLPSWLLGAARTAA